MENRIARSCLALLMCLAVWGCGHGGSNGVTQGSGGRVTVHVTWPATSRAIPLNTTALRLSALVDGKVSGYNLEHPEFSSVILNRPNSTSAAPPTNQAILAGLPVGKQVSLTLQAFGGPPRLATGNPKNDNYDQNGNLYIGAATLPTFTVKANDPNVVNAEVFSNIDHIKATAAYVNGDKPLSDHTPVAGELLKLTATAYTTDSAGAEVVVVTDDSQWNWSQVEQGNTAPPLILSASPSEVPADTAAQMQGRRVVYCQGGVTPDPGNPAHVQLSLAEVNKSAILPLAFAPYINAGNVAPTLKYVGENERFQNDPSSTDFYYWVKTLRLSAIALAAPPAGRSILSSRSTRAQRTHADGVSPLYVATFDAFVSPGGSVHTVLMNYDQWKIDVRLSSLLSDNPAQNAGGQPYLKQDYVGSSGLYQYLPDDYSRIRDVDGQAYVMTGNTYGILAWFPYFAYNPQQTRSFRLTRTRIANGVAGQTDNLRDVDGQEINQIVSDLRAAPQPSDSQPSDSQPPLSYALVPFGKNNGLPGSTALLTFRDTETQAIQHLNLPDTLRDADHFAVDEFGVFYVANGNQIYRVTNVNGTASVTPFLPSGSNQTFSAIRDISYEGGYIYVLDTSPDALQARLAVLTNAGLQAGTTTKLGDADLNLLGHRLFPAYQVYTQTSRMVVVGKTVFLNLPRSFGESYDPIAQFSFN